MLKYQLHQQGLRSGNRETDSQRELYNLYDSYVTCHEEVKHA